MLPKNQELEQLRSQVEAIDEIKLNPRFSIFVAIILAASGVFGQGEKRAEAC